MPANIFFAELVQSLYISRLRGLICDLCAEWDDRALERLIKSFGEGGLVSLDYVVDASQEAIAIHCFLPPLFGQA